MGKRTLTVVEGRRLTSAGIVYPWTPWQCLRLLDRVAELEDAVLSLLEWDAGYEVQLNEALATVIAKCRAALREERED